MANHMKKRIRNLSIGCLCLLFIISCCNEKGRYYWFPEDAVRFYNDHDTITFYSSELNEYEVYPVCSRDTLLSLNEYMDRCNNADYLYSIEYSLVKDSCVADREFNIQINSDNSIYFHSIYSADHFENVFLLYNEFPKSTIVVLGKTYENTIELDNSFSDSLEFVIFSLEYGIIQFKFENVTFSLINDEK